MLPTQDPIAAVSAPTGRQLSLPSIAWLRIEMASGRKFELVPVEQFFKDESYPRLAIKIRETRSFKEVRSWPGGPELDWATPEGLQALKGLSLVCGHWLRRSELGPPEGYEATLSNLAVVRISHSQELPMSLDLTLSPARRSAA
jgi:hypothetical protein